MRKTILLLAAVSLFLGGAVVGVMSWGEAYRVYKQSDEDSEQFAQGSMTALESDFAQLKDVHRPLATAAGITVADTRRIMKEAQWMPLGFERRRALDAVTKLAQQARTVVHQAVDEAKAARFSLSTSIDNSPGIVLFLVDRSGSMQTQVVGENRTRCNLAVELAVARMKALRTASPDLQAGLCFFDDRLYESWPVTDKLNKINEHLEEWLQSGCGGGGSDLYDTFLQPAEKTVAMRAGEILQQSLPGRAGNRRLIIITDCDLGLLPERKSEMISALEQKGITVELHKVGRSPLSYIN